MLARSRPGVRGGVLVALGLLCAACAPTREPAPPAPAADLPALLRATWDGYRQRFIQGDGRVLRPLDGHDTVSEGQAYALLRAVWMDDRPTFDRVYRWTEAHLSRRSARGDALLAWHWGRRPAGDWGVLDWTAATDADEDYALALLFAARRWGGGPGDLPPYGEGARAVLAALLAKGTRHGADGRLYLLPGDWPEPRLILNPSYFAPAWYRIFSRETGDPRWMALVESSYHALAALAARLGDRQGVGLMPDWAALGTDGRFRPAEGFSDAHGWDAFRAAWRVALDWAWFQEPRARRYLTEGLAPFLRGEWARNDGRLWATYAYVGTPLARTESAATYAGYLAALRTAGAAEADLVVARLVRAARADPQGMYFDVAEDYYLNNWAWFGLLLGAGGAVNLAGS